VALSVTALRARLARAEAAAAAIVSKPGASSGALEEIKQRESFRRLGELLDRAASKQHRGEQLDAKDQAAWDFLQTQRRGDDGR
jgi:hypothetical protein